jgi:hypothetical protein
MTTKLLTRLKVFNPGLKSENWKITEKETDPQG